MRRAAADKPRHASATSAACPAIEPAAHGTARAPSRAAAALVALASALVFALVAWPALDENAATYDETYHVPAGYTYLTRGDFRLGPEHPPLVKELLAVPLLSLAPTVGSEAERAFAAAAGAVEAQYVFGDRFLYRDNAPQPLVRRARLVIVLLAAATVALVSLWAHAAFGATAALTAGALAALDPTLLAHGTLATTDAGFALFFTATLFAARAALRRIGAVAVLATGVSLGAAMAAKHTALLLPLVLTVAAMLRVGDPTPWPVGGRGPRALARRRARAGAALALLTLWGVMAWAGVWTAYGWRWSAVPDASPSLPLAEWTARIREERVVAARLAAGDEVPEASDLARLAAAEPPTLIERAIDAAARHRLAPEAYLYGLAVATALAQVRSNFLLGDISLVGWTWYFPFAVLVKTPIGTLAIVAAAVALLAGGTARRRWGATPAQLREGLLVLIPLTLVLLAATRSNVNIGIRHVLPAIPFLCLLAAVVPAAVERTRGRRAALLVSGTTVLLLAAETLAARPYFLPFFNVAAGRARGGLRLLSDSNLDWGQGLPALRRWMEGAGVHRINLCYFGTAEPARYGIRSVALAGSHFGSVAGLGTVGHRPEPPALPGWVAISATHLQGTYLSPALRAYYAFLRDREPAAIAGGSIYVYRVERWGEAP